jgi:hypothetical protein
VVVVLVVVVVVGAVVVVVAPVVVVVAPVVVVVAPVVVVVAPVVVVVAPVVVVADPGSVGLFEQEFNNASPATQDAIARTLRAVFRDCDSLIIDSSTSRT